MVTATIHVVIPGTGTVLLPLVVRVLVVAGLRQPLVLAVVTVTVVVVAVADLGQTLLLLLLRGRPIVRVTGGLAQRLRVRARSGLVPGVVVLKVFCASTVTRDLFILVPLHCCGFFG